MAKPLNHFGHNYNYVSRAVMYSWFNKHLKLGLEEPVVEEDYQPLSIAEMSVWDDRHPRPAGRLRSSTGLPARSDRSDAAADRSARKNDEQSLAEYRRIVAGAVQVMIGRGLPAAGSWKSPIAAPRISARVRS